MSHRENLGRCVKKQGKEFREFSSEPMNVGINYGGEIEKNTTND